MTDSESALLTSDFAGIKMRMVMQEAAPWFIASGACLRLAWTWPGALANTCGT